MIGPRQVTEEEVRESYAKAMLLDPLVEDVDARARRVCDQLTMHTNRFDSVLARYAARGVPVGATKQTVYFSRWNESIDYEVMADLVFDTRKWRDRPGARQEQEIHVSIRQYLDRQNSLLRRIQELGELQDTAYTQLLELTIIEEPFAQNTLEEAILYLTSPGTGKAVRERFDLNTGIVQVKEDTQLPAPHILLRRMLLEEVEKEEANIYIIHKPCNRIAPATVTKQVRDILRKMYCQATGKTLPEDLQFRLAMDNMLDVFGAEKCIKPLTFTDLHGNVAGFTDDGTIPKELADSLLADDERGMMQ